MRHTSHRWVESLENRRLLSASADALLLDSSATDIAAMVVVPEVTTPDVLGTFTGSLTSSKEKTTGSLTITITTETHTFHLVGTAVSKFPHEHTGLDSFTGKIKGENFTLNMDNGTIITGKATDHGHVLTGTYTNSPDGSHGSFSVSR
jgi:hypothetical protein